MHRSRLQALQQQQFVVASRTMGEKKARRVEVETLEREVHLNISSQDYEHPRTLLNTTWSSNNRVIEKMVLEESASRIELETSNARNSG